MFEKIIFIYGIEAALRLTENKKGNAIISTLQQVKLSPTNLTWANIGGQLIPQKYVDSLLAKIKNDTIKSWDEVHAFYESESDKYNSRKDLHALAILEKLTNKTLSKITVTTYTKWLDEYFEIKKDITERIQNTRAKDYENPFRKMVYNNDAEMNAVVGALKDNGFIKDQQKALTLLADKLNDIKIQMKDK
jgi:23S rRNA maturation mini-RNase III